MTPDAFLYIKKKFPEEFKAMAILEIHVSRLDLFCVKKEKNKTNSDRYGQHLAAIFEWLDEHCEQPYYVKMNYAESRRVGSALTTVTFYFMEPTDAMAFKLMFQ